MLPVATPNRNYVGFNTVEEARHFYVEWSTREHWMRQQLHKIRSAQWKATGAAEKEQLALDAIVVEWLYCEAQHWMVFWRALLQSYGVNPGGQA